MDNFIMTEESKAEEGQQKKPERVVAVPTCPSAVSTALLLLRAAIASVTGAAACDQNVSLLQATYVKDKRLTGKFAVQLGKKTGACELDLSEDKAEIEALLNAIEATANRLASEDNGIYCFKIAKSDLINLFGNDGNGVLDGSHANEKKVPPETILTLAYMKSGEIAAAAALPSVPFARTGLVRRIELNRSNCGVVANKKKAEISLKFEVMGNEVTQELAVVQEELSAIDVASIQSKEIRCPEGKVLRETQLRVAAKVAETSVSGDDPPVASTESNEMVVNAYEVKGKIDYEKLVNEFGSTIISYQVMKKLYDLTVGKGRVPCLHRFLRRDIFFSHRDLEVLLDQVSNGTPLYLYTGRGPSSESMHLGHLIPFLFTQWLQKALDVPLVIQMTDDEKFLFKGVYEDETGDNLDNFSRLTIENARDIIACGFDFEKTFLFSDLDYVGRMYPNVVRIWKAVTTNKVSNIFGFDGSSNIGKIAFPAIQAAPSFASSFPTVLQADRSSDMLCLIPCAIDQDPYFRMTRDIAHKLVHKKHKLGGKPALIHSKFFPPLQGATGKMSSSDQNSAIFLTDTAEEIQYKIKHHALSGGQEKAADQRKLGANLEVDVAYQWLRFFLEDDDELKRIGEEYSSGQGEYWCTSKVKERLASVLQELVAEHQKRRAEVTDDEVRKWMSERKLVF
ncbi:tryptophanyl-tRNA synthetase [Fistulifera solaris]|uniref:Tryptophan--tRNA ligase, cytoplasmic n=1 Tax=Fistulifera solaris TaxID=1519565 RepID=A0A1Z5JFP9_FISSO|nr:tryptophanyl-tRNA synthetase [Fistulifera solaris]|eukprot:GAX12835.1 tryptophanyl-tRNA synthetase [Fistulifera solaris]